MGKVKRGIIGREREEWGIIFLWGHGELGGKRTAREAYSHRLRLRLRLRLDLTPACGLFRFRYGLSVTYQVPQGSWKEKRRFLSGLTI